MFGFHHARARKRAGLPKKAIDWLIYPVAIASPLALVPQVVQLYATHSAAGLSYLTWTLLAALNFLWVFYGFLHRERPIIITNLTFMLLDLAIVGGIFLYQ